MKKNAWPWIGTTEHEMGSMAPKGEETDIEQDTQEPHDALVPEKSVVEEQGPSMDYEENFISPVDEVSYAEDMPLKASVEVHDEDGVLANFSCDVASTIQEKVAGLQLYDNLGESAGLVFEYRRPEDVIYHMGTVKFPIDIIFIDADSKVKKIYKEIQPGTLATFGCANVKNVLEICGGLSDRLGIRKGNSIKINKNRDSEIKGVSLLNKSSKNFGIKKNVIVKYSSFGRNGFSNWNGFPILNITDDLDKKASKPSLLSDLVSKFTIESKKKIYAFDFDGLIEDSPAVRVYKTSEAVEDEVPYIRVDGQTVSLKKTDYGNEIYRDVHLYELSKESLDKDESILSSLSKSYAGFINSPKVIEDAFKVFHEIRKASKDSNARVIIVTRSPNPEYLRDIVCDRIGLQFGEKIAAEVIGLEKSADAVDIVDTLRDKVGNYDIRVFSDSSILKRAGSPVPDEVKSKAKKIYKLLHSASETVETSLENMKKNVAEYDKIKESPDKIKKTKGQYNQSVKSNTRVVRDFLIKIRDAIKMFNSIKDISTTMEIIDSLTSSTKIASDSIEEIFDLIDQIESPDFHMMLTEKVGNYERTVEDLQSSIDKGKDYINADILGLIVLSD